MKYFAVGGRYLVVGGTGENQWRERGESRNETRVNVLKNLPILYFSKNLVLQEHIAG